jgi:hypothetical protein
MAPVSNKSLEDYGLFGTEALNILLWIGTKGFIRFGNPLVNFSTDKKNSYKNDEKNNNIFEHLFSPNRSSLLLQLNNNINKDSQAVKIIP